MHIVLQRFISSPSHDVPLLQTAYPRKNMPQSRDAKHSETPVLPMKSECEEGRVVLNHRMI